MTQDIFFIAIFIVLGIIGSLVTSALTPSIDETWGKTDGIVLEGTEWIEYDDSYESCEYDEVWDDTYDCYYTYSYDCGADVYYNYSVDGVNIMQNTNYGWVHGTTTV